ncbi:MAG: DUF4349 domain-containing protein [Blastocatellia bacterium]|nr:DUF4349 domain-containing protein [Blastocatellia bacterium]
MKTKLIVFLLLVFLTGCANEAPLSNNEDRDSGSANSAAPSSRKDDSGGEKSPITTQVSLDQADKSKTENVPTERKIIRNADLQLESSAPEEAQQKISTIAESKGGFVVESQQRSSSSNVTTRDTVTMTIRVPAAKFNESLDEIRKVASHVIIETVKGQDVTEEFVDIEARLKTKKALEEQFLEIMKQGKTVQDALQVQRELANVRGEIEQIEGRKRFLENQSSLSTIKILLQTPTAYSPSSSGFFYQLGNAISSGFDFALKFILALVYFVIAILPFLLFVVLPIYLILRYFWRRLRIRKAVKEIVEEEVKTE